MSEYDQKIPMLPPYRVRTVVSILSETMDYNHRMMNIPFMWKDTMGEGVKVAVLDTGLPSHSDLKPVGGKSFVEGYLLDRNGHGTHCSGIVAATANNGLGVAGIAPSCQLYCGAVLGEDGSGTINGIIDGIRWAVDEIGARVISMSLGIAAGAPRYKELEKACDYAVSRGTVVVAAAGNENAGVGQPGCYESVISVAAVDAGQKRASFSDYGPEVDFAAGGVDVYSTWLNNGYAKLSGTSMACPALAGVVALIMADEFKDTGKWLTKDEVYAKLQKIAYNVSGHEFDEYDGWGIPMFGNNGSPDTKLPEPEPEPETKGCFGLPMTKQFLDAAVAALNAGRTTEEAIGEGMKVSQAYVSRVAGMGVRRM